MALPQPLILILIILPKTFLTKIDESLFHLYHKHYWPSNQPFKRTLRFCHPPFTQSQRALPQTPILTLIIIPITLIIHIDDTPNLSFSQTLMILQPNFLIKSYGSPTHHYHKHWWSFTLLTNTGLSSYQPITQKLIAHPTAFHTNPDDYHS